MKILSWKIQHPRTLAAGFAIIALGSVFTCMGEVAMLFIGFPLLAVGLGFAFAAHTIVEGG